MMYLAFDSMYWVWLNMYIANFYRATQSDAWQDHSMLTREIWTSVY